MAWCSIDNKRIKCQENAYLQELVRYIHLIAERVAGILKKEPSEIFSKGRQKRKVKARSLLCFWAARELGMSHTSLAKKLELSIAAIGFSVERGETIAKEKNYLLVP